IGAGDAASEIGAVRRRRRDARRLRGAASRSEGDGEPAAAHEDAFTALADLDRLAVVEHGAPKPLGADRTEVPLLSRDAQAVGGRFGAHHRAAMRTLPAGPC